MLFFRPSCYGYTLYSYLVNLCPQSNGATWKNAVHYRAGVVNWLPTGSGNTNSRCLMTTIAERTSKMKKNCRKTRRRKKKRVLYAAAAAAAAVLPTNFVVIRPGRARVSGTLVPARSKSANRRRRRNPRVGRVTVATWYPGTRETVSGTVFGRSSVRFPGRHWSLCRPPSPRT